MPIDFMRTIGSRPPWTRWLKPWGSLGATIDSGVLRHQNDPRSLSKLQMILWIREKRLLTPATAEDIAAVAIAVPADGTGLPPGKGDAVTGKQVYETACAACHGAK